MQTDDVVTRVSRAIFDYCWPQSCWTDPLFAREREDCRLLAVQFRQMFLAGVQTEPVFLWSIPSGQGIDERWRQAFVAGKFAEVLAELSAGVPLKSLDATDRAWVREQADITVEAAVDRFTQPVKDDGSNYQPQDEPEYDFDGRTESEVSR